MKGILILVCCLLILAGCHKDKYQGGKDTVDSFSDGRFQILRGPDYYMFVDMEGKIPQIDQVNAWKRKKESLYLQQTNGTVWIVNLDNGGLRSGQRGMFPQ